MIHDQDLSIHANIFKGDWPAGISDFEKDVLPVSAIFGYINLNGDQASQADLECMNAALAPYGSDDGGIWTQGAVGLGQRLMHLTPEDRFERQPWVSADGQRALVSSARLDNRAELLADGEPGLNPISDGELILRAYERWGADCVQHLVGAYAFALWDARQQRLLLARSAIGGPSLFYYAAPQVLAFATMPQGLFALPFIPREIDEPYLADYLVWARPERDATFYRRVKRLPPGHWAGVSPNGVQIRPHWQPDLKREIYFPRDDDYVQAFNELFERVVRDHMRSAAPVGVMMSGGFDSTAVAATATRLLKREEKRLATFTEVPRAGFDGAIIQARYPDETVFVQAMAQQYDNLDLNLVRTDERVFWDDLDRFFDAAAIPFRNASNRVWYEEILRQARQQGVRVLLTGGLGNATISWNGSGLLSQLLRQMKWRRALREARALARQGNARSTMHALVGQGILPLLPAAWSLAIKRIGRQDAPASSRSHWRAYSAINPEFAAMHRADERLREQGLVFHGTRPDTRAMRGDMITGAAGLGDGLATGYRALFGVDLRDPTGDVRMVEFCLALPEEQYLRNGQSRWLIRRAMADRLPRLILENKQRGLQAADWFERLSSAQTQILDELARLETSELARRALDLPRLRRLAEQMPQTDGNAARQMADYRLILEFGLMTGRFLHWFEGAT